MRKPNLVKCFAVILVSAMCMSQYSCSKDDAADNANSTTNNKDSGTTATEETGNPDGLGGLIGSVVDLGLSVKWADHNVGAKSVSDYGGTYGWADPTGTLVTSSVWDENSRWKPNLYGGPNPSSNISGSSFDIAHVKWGGSWRMPTGGEFVELYNNCTYKDSTVNGVKGVRFTSKRNYRSIFFPFAGAHYSSNVNVQGGYGFYWSSTLYDDNNHYYAHYLYIYGSASESDGILYGTTGLSYGMRYMGLCVRPVM